MRTRAWFQIGWPRVTVILVVANSLLFLGSMTRPGKTSNRNAASNSAEARGLIPAVVRVSREGEFPQATAPAPHHDTPRDDSDAHEAQKFLDAMKESSLRAIAPADRTLTVYRVVWLPTFHSPISVRVVKSEQGVAVHATQLEGGGGYDPGKVSVSKTSELTSEQWDDLCRHVNEAEFWSLSSAAKPDLTADGDFLIVEGVRGGEYHQVERHCPKAESYVSLCRFMLDLSGIEVEGVWEAYHRNR